MSTIKTADLKNTLMIKLPVHLDKTFAAELEHDAKFWLLKAVELFVFDFAGVESLNEANYRAFVMFAQAVRRVDKQVTSLNMSSELRKQVSRAGVNDAFNPMTLPAKETRGTAN